MGRNCKYFKICGGCDLLNQDYNQQLENKTNRVKELFKNEKIVAKIRNIIGMDAPFEFRNKLHLAFSEYKGKLNIGFYKKNSKEVIDIDNCPMHARWMKKISDIIRKFVKDFKISIYNTRLRQGVLRYVVARNYKDSVIVTLVVSNLNFPGKTILYKMLQNEFKFVSLYLNINKRTDSAVFDNNFKFISGEKGLIVNFMGVDFTLSPKSFMQTNLQIATKIYQKAIELISKDKVEVILDLFSGIGITSLIFAKNGTDVIAVESEKSSVNDAMRIQKQNNLQNKIKNVCAKCEDVIVPICDSIKDKKVSIFLDPPRSGVATIVLNEILKSEPKQIVYLSCNAETLVKDLKILLRNKKYKVEFVQPYDMFPHTNHIEILVLLTCNN